jgi:hypothetical protein
MGNMPGRRSSTVSRKGVAGTDGWQKWSGSLMKDFLADQQGLVEGEIQHSRGDPTPLALENQQMETVYGVEETRGIDPKRKLTVQCWIFPHPEAQ